MVAEVLDDFLIGVCGFAQTQFLVTEADVELGFGRDFAALRELLQDLFIKFDGFFKIALDIFVIKGFLENLFCRLLGCRIPEHKKQTGSKKQK